MYLSVDDAHLKNTVSILRTGMRVQRLNGLAYFLCPSTLYIINKFYLKKHVEIFDNCSDA